MGRSRRCRLVGVQRWRWVLATLAVVRVQGKSLRRKQHVLVETPLVEAPPPACLEAWATLSAGAAVPFLPTEAQLSTVFTEDPRPLESIPNMLKYIESFAGDHPDVFKDAGAKERIALEQVRVATSRRLRARPARRSHYLTSSSPRAAAAHPAAAPGRLTIRLPLRGRARSCPPASRLPPRPSTRAPPPPAGPRRTQRRPSRAYSPPTRQARTSPAPPSSSRKPCTTWARTTAT